MVWGTHHASWFIFHTCTLPFTVISLCPHTMRLFNLNAQYTVKFSAPHLAVSWLTWLVTASHFGRPGFSPSMPVLLSLLFRQCLYIHVPLTVCNLSNWQSCWIQHPSIPYTNSVILHVQKVATWNSWKPTNCKPQHYCYHIVRNKSVTLLTV